jgi:uncharacterized protein (TIGR02001 family)
MLTSIRGLAAASFVTGLALSATPALAETANPEAEFDLATLEAASDVTVDVTEFAPATEPVEAISVNELGADSGFELSGNVALVSEYRFRGVDLSGGDIAVQGGIDLAHSSGFYVGTWGSSLDEDTVGYGHTELDIYGGFSGDLGEGVSFDIGAIAYLYPNAGPGDFDYFEFYGSVGFGIGPAESTIGIAYAPDQDSLGSTDNLYIYYDWSLGIPETPLTVTAHIGYTDGFLTFTDDGDAFDWSIGVEAAVYGPVSVGVAYVDVQDNIPSGDYDFGDSAIVFTLSASI